MRTLTLALIAATAFALPAAAQPLGTTATPNMNTTISANQVAQVAPVAVSGGLGKVFDEADTNRDNAVTRQEFEALADKHFAMADTNHDGRVTRDEMQAQQNAIMQQMQQNLFGKGGNWQGKLNQFLGGANGTVGAAPTTPVVVSPTAPVVAPPTAPTMPGTSY